MSKYIDLEDDEREKLGDLMEVKAIQLGLDKWESPSGRISPLQDMIGICHNCTNMRYCKSEFENVKAWCWTFKMYLNGQDRITECNEHNERGRMSLRDMEMIATLIDSDKSEIRGFISNDPRLRKKE